jgi:hypothetical protein
MADDTENDPLAAVREAGTSAPNYDIDNAEIIDRLTEWQSLCSFVVGACDGDSIEIEFETLPSDMEAFSSDLYDFCPDLVDQGTGCVHEMVEAMEEMGEELTPDLQKLIEGVDFNDENYGLEILKRELEAKKSITLWWD